MSIHLSDKALLEKLGENGERWIKESWGDEARMCLHGAIHRCSPVPGDAYIVEKVADRQGWGTGWNDDPERRWSDIREKINGGIDVTDEDLEATFGPQWREIVALVRRSAVLTEEEVRRLDAARDAASHAAWAAAWDARDAARHAARDATRHAAWAAAWDARDAARDAAVDAAVDAARDATWDARDAARAAAWDVRAAARAATWLAATALVVRDLIGRHGFTQEHYDTLTAPWREVIGPVHPDDVGEEQA